MLLLNLDLKTSPFGFSSIHNLSCCFPLWVISGMAWSFPDGFAVQSMEPLCIRTGTIKCMFVIISIEWTSTVYWDDRHQSYLYIRMFVLISVFVRVFFSASMNVYFSDRSIAHNILHCAPKITFANFQHLSISLMGERWFSID